MDLDVSESPKQTIPWINFDLPNRDTYPVHHAAAIGDINKIRLLLAPKRLPLFSLSSPHNIASSIYILDDRGRAPIHYLAINRDEQVRNDEWVGEAVRLLVGLDDEDLEMNSTSNLKSFMELETKSGKVFALLSQMDDAGGNSLSLSHMVDVMMRDSSDTDTIKISNMTRALEMVYGGRGIQCLNTQNSMFSTVYHTLSLQVWREIDFDDRQVSNFEEFNWKIALDVIFQSVKLWKISGLDIHAKDWFSNTGADILKMAVEYTKKQSLKKLLEDLLVKLETI